MTELTQGYRVYVFDVYGTLLDVHSAVDRAAAHLGPRGARLSAIWRRRQLEYTWVRTLCHQYKDFWAVTEEALDYALLKVAEAGNVALRTNLLAAYRELDPYPDVHGALRRLRALGKTIVALSNGSDSMIGEALKVGELHELVDVILSADTVRAFKTTPEVYDQIWQRLDTDRETVSFQSSNRWDIAGASAAGLRTIWVNRNGQPDEYPDLGPDLEITTLADLQE